jgi:hypothetical protein
VSAEDTGHDGSDHLVDRVARARAGGLSRREALRMLLGASVAAAAGGAVAATVVTRDHHATTEQVRSKAPAAPQADSGCDGTRRPLTGPDDCQGSRVSKQGYTPTFNGCGPAGVGGYVVPDQWDDYVLTPACDNHDRCYGTCGSSKDTCDMNFLNDMRNICQADFGPWNPNRYDCYSASWIYYQAVHQFGGGPYADGQVEGCDCCVRQCIYCHCNETYYESATACTAECHASLACFSGICVDADVSNCGV